MDRPGKSGLQIRLKTRQRLAVEVVEADAEALGIQLGLGRSLAQRLAAAIDLEPALATYQRVGTGSLDHRRVGLQAAAYQRGVLRHDLFVASGRRVLPVLEQRPGACEHRARTIANVDLTIGYHPQQGRQIAREGIGTHRLALDDAGVAVGGLATGLTAVDKCDLVATAPQMPRHRHTDHAGSHYHHLARHHFLLVL